MLRTLGNLFSGGPAGGYGLGFGGGLGSGGFNSGLDFGLGGAPFGSALDFSAFGGGGANNRFGLDFGYSGLDLGLDLYAGGGLGKKGGGVTASEILGVIVSLAPFIYALFGREREFARSRGAVPATGAGAGPGYTRVRNPETGEQMDVPDELVNQYAERYADAYNAGAGGGISSTALLVGAGVIGGLFYINRRKAGSR